ncbi:MAG: PKD domain-containing protein [Flavobacteriales bacterium]|nr:PKD domain-containing protein [Flavobacteriales bacterium]
MKNIVLILFVLALQSSAKAQCSASFTLLPDSSGTIYGDNTSFADTSVWYVYDASGALLNVYSSWDLTHTTATTGAAVYTVCLYTYTNPPLAFCDSTCQTITIVGGPACSANFTGTQDTSGYYDFLNLSSGTGLSYYWDFGDGTNSSLESPTHNYTANGTYSVCLTVWNSSGCADTLCDNVVVSTLGSGSPCEASFVGAQDTLGIYNFWSLSSGASPLFYYWDFGDGANSSLENPSHNYAAAGTYLVCLMVWNSGGCADTLCDSVVVGGSGWVPPCEADFIWFPDTSSNMVYLWNLSSGSSGVSCFWDFGDGNTSNLTFPSHTYAVNGAYLVCLTVVDSVGCVSTYCDSVSVPLKSSGFTINVVPPGVTQVNDEQTVPLSHVVLYPNPTDGDVVLTFTSGSFFKSTAHIYSADGKIWGEENIVAHPGENKAVLDFKDLPAGLYLVLINTEFGIKTYRVIRS